MKVDEVLDCLEQFEWLPAKELSSLRATLAKYANKGEEWSGEKLLKWFLKKEKFNKFQINKIINHTRAAANPETSASTVEKVDRQDDSKPAGSVSSASTDAADMLPPADSENGEPAVESNTSVVTKDSRSAATDTSVSQDPTKTESSTVAQAVRQEKQSAAKTAQPTVESAAGSEVARVATKATDHPEAKTENSTVAQAVRQEKQPAAQTAQPTVQSAAGKGSSAKTVQQTKGASQRQSTASPSQRRKRQESRQRAGWQAERHDRRQRAAVRLESDSLLAVDQDSSPEKRRSPSGIEQRRGGSRRKRRPSLLLLICFLVLVGLACLAVFNNKQIRVLQQQLAGETNSSPPAEQVEGRKSPKKDGSKTNDKALPADTKPNVPAKGEKPAGNDSSEGVKKILAEIMSLKELVKRLEKRIESNESGLDELRVRVGEHKVDLPGSELSLRFVLVPAGTFAFGYRDEDIDQLFEVFKKADDPQVLVGHNAKPAVRIQVARDFFILEHEVTRGQFAVFQRLRVKKETAKSGSSTAKPSAPTKEAAAGLNDLMPKADVTWPEAQEFCKWIGEIAKRKVRLPTEIEWEYTARGHEPQPYPWKGDGFHAWAGKNVGDTASPRPVNAKDNKDVSWREVFDMSGNVSEWCLDRYETGLHGTLTKKIGTSKYYLYDPNNNSAVKNALRKDPAEPRPFRTYRGGAYKDHPGQSQVSGRRSLQGIKSSPAIGFRPVLLLAPRGSGN